MRIKKIFISFYVYFAIIWAQTVKNKNKSKLTVEADESLEWFERKILYGKRNVVLKMVTLKADNVKDYVFENGENILQKIAKNK